MGPELWSWDALVTASGGTPDPKDARPPDITGFSIDTRSLQAGDVFVALKDARDGHEFVSAAFAAGAAAALVSQTYARKPGDGALLRVADPLRGLEAIARAARARLALDARVIAITGSAGKTGTTAMLRACLAPLGATHAPEKSFNNHWGVPLTLARMPADTCYGVFEIGMNHSGEITPLTKLVRPHIAIITNVLPVHVGNFPDGESGIAAAKAEIFAGLEAPPAIDPSPLVGVVARRAGGGEPQALRSDPGRRLGQASIAEHRSTMTRDPTSTGGASPVGSREKLDPTYLSIKSPPQSSASPETVATEGRRGYPGSLPRAFETPSDARTGEAPGPSRSGAASGDATERGTMAVAIIPRYSGYFDLLSATALTQGATLKTFRSLSAAPCDAQIVSIAPVGVASDVRSLVTASVSGRIYTYPLGTKGAHIAANSLAVLLCLDELGLLSTDNLRPLCDIGPARGRGERTLLETANGPILLIDESYNANPASMLAALDVTRRSIGPAFHRGVVVLGDMLELGHDSERFHADLGRTMPLGEIDRDDRVFACGPMMKLMLEALRKDPPSHMQLPQRLEDHWAPTSLELIPLVLKELRPGDVVMVKGSLGSRMAPIVEAIKKHFAGAAGGR